MVMAVSHRANEAHTSRSRVAPVAPSISSSRTTPIPATSRFELLLHEQKTLVKNAQEGLEQAMDMMTKASQSENKEGARLQVESLMNRATELYLMFQVVTEIRNEFAHVQQELAEAKRSQRKTYDLEDRLLWLEQRLERLLLARKRGRPAARARRATLPQQPLVRGRRSGVVALFPPPASQQPPSLSKSITESLPSPTSQATSPTLQPYSKQTGSSFTSKRSPSGDSDVWHSESEANWTIMDAYSIPNKDMTQSQVLSSADEQEGDRASSMRVQHRTQDATTDEKRAVASLRTVSVARSPSSQSSSDDSAVNNFEPARPVEVFGDCSWNSLYLALNTNHLAEGHGHKRNNSDAPFLMSVDRELKEAIMQAGLDSVYDEMHSLRQLIHSAARAATRPGGLACPALTRQQRDNLTIHHRSSTTPGDHHHRAQTPNSAEGRSPRFPLLTEIPASNTVYPSRKVYGTKAKALTFPRPSDLWYNRSSNTHQTLPHLRMANKARELQFFSAAHRKTRQQSLTMHLADGGADPLDRRLHQESCIEYLLAKAESPLVESRTDAVRALGFLSTNDPQVKSKLIDKMTRDTDCRVKYEALKSLLRMGAVNQCVVDYTSHILASGSTKVWTDLLQILSSEDVLQSLQSSESAGELVPVLLPLAQDGSTSVSLPAIVVMSHLRAERQCCVDKLKSVLSHPNPHCQSLALRSLVLCWQCCTPDIIKAAMEQMKSCHIWKLRLSAVQLLMAMGKAHVQEQEILDFLLERLGNEPVQAVKIAIRKLLEELDLDKKAYSLLIGKLESSSEITRREAIASLTAFEFRSASDVQPLLELLEFDPSTAVRVQVSFSKYWEDLASSPGPTQGVWSRDGVVRLFALTECHHPAVIQTLQKKSRGAITVARACLKALKNLGLR